MRAARELRELLSQEGFQRPLALAREKVEARGEAAGTIALSAVSPEELRCLTGVLGRSWRAPVAGEDVDGLSPRRLDGALRASRFACTLPEALARVPTAGLSSRPAPQLDARLAPLAQALRAGGRAIHEEALIEPLLRDLAEPASAVAPSAAAPSLAGVYIEDRGS